MRIWGHKSIGPLPPCEQSPRVKPVRSEPLDRPPQVAEVREDGADDVLAQALPVGEQLLDGRLREVESHFQNIQRCSNIRHITFELK